MSILNVIFFVYLCFSLFCFSVGNNSVQLLSPFIKFVLLDPSSPQALCSVRLLLCTRLIEGTDSFRKEELLTLMIENMPSVQVCIYFVQVFHPTTICASHLHRYGKHYPRPQNVLVSFVIFCAMDYELCQQVAR